MPMTIVTPKAPGEQDNVRVSLDIDFAFFVLAFVTQKRMAAENEAAALDPADTDLATDPDSVDNSPVFMFEKKIYGLQPRMLFKNGRPLTIELRGEGFEPDDVITIALMNSTTGDRVDLHPFFISAESVSVTVPPGTGVGYYDVHVSVNEVDMVLVKGFYLLIQSREGNIGLSMEPDTSAGEQPAASGNQNPIVDDIDILDSNLYRNALLNMTTP